MKAEITDCSELRSGTQQSFFFREQEIEIRIGDPVGTPPKVNPAPLIFPYNC